MITLAENAVDMVFTAFGSTDNNTLCINSFMDNTVGLTAMARAKNECFVHIFYILFI